MNRYVTIVTSYDAEAKPCLIITSNNRNIND